MKKTLFLAGILVAGAASVSIAQFSADEKNLTVGKEAVITASDFKGLPLQDTTKPKKDSLPPKQDSTSIKF